MLCPVVFLKSGTGAIFGPWLTWPRDHGADPGVSRPHAAAESPSSASVTVLRKRVRRFAPVGRFRWGETLHPPASTEANRSSAGPCFPDSCAPVPIGAFWRSGTGSACSLWQEPSREVGCHRGHEGHWGDRSRAAAPYPSAKFFVRFPTRLRSHQRRFPHEEVFEFVRPSAPRWLYGRCGGPA